MTSSELAEPAPPRLSLGALFARFLRFGLLAFGGPVAQIGMLRHELVDRERWTTPERFLRALAVYQALPGPEAHEMCCWFGYLARGRLGSIVAGLGFLLPGFALMLVAAWLYQKVGLHAPWSTAAFAGAQTAVMALVVRAVPRIGAHALRPRLAWVAALAGLACGLADISFAIPLAFGALWLPIALRSRASAWMLAIGALAISVWLWLSSPTTPTQLAAAPQTAAPHFGSLLALGLQAGLFTFGGAYTAIPFVRDVAVVSRSWLSDAQFLDGIAIGSVLPAPLVIFGTFTGYIAGGLAGALAMTIGIFAPAFCFTLIGHAWIERAMHNQRLHASLDGVAAAVTGLIAATAIQLLLRSVTHGKSATIFALALAIAFAWKSPWAMPLIVAFGAVAGLVSG
jgi:chromate transporter